MQMKAIAVVDDDEVVRTATSHLLRSFGYTARAFASAEAFLNAGVADTLCLISDVRMPGMSGVELQARLVRDACKFPIIFVTAFCDESTRARTLAAGAHSYLTKPYDAERLMHCVEAALQKPLKRASS
ncbi:MAG: response regulator [Alphaproteobacteria bacterium]|nr:MAG: response regulator [Alphaproteobacteria bacterium]